MPSDGPLKTLLFLRANTGKLGEPGPTPRPPHPLPASLKTGSVPRPPGGGRRLTRMPDGKLVPVGVAGRTLTLACGLQPIFEPDAEESPEGDAKLADALEVLEALLCEWWCPPPPPAPPPPPTALTLCTLWYALRILLTLELVDLRPRRPAELRRW